MLYSRRGDGWARSKGGGAPVPDNGSSAPFGAPYRGASQPSRGGALPTYNTGSGGGGGGRGGRATSLESAGDTAGALDMALAAEVGSSCGCKDKRRKLILGALLAGAGFVAGRYIWPRR